MAKTKYNFYSDDAHGWLEVPRAEVETSDITVTPYSYYNPKTDMVYLEEDVDMINFMDATGTTLSDMRMQSKSFSPRNLPAFNEESDMVARRLTKKEERLVQTLANIKHELRPLSETYMLPYNTLYSAFYEAIMETLEAV